MRRRPIRRGKAQAGGRTSLIRLRVLPSLSSKKPIHRSWSGILAIRCKRSGRAYFIAVNDTRQRAYDHHRLLCLGRHHNKELQSAWGLGPEDFEFLVVEQVRCPALLSAFKEVWVQRAAENCFNCKAAVPRTRKRS